MSAASYACMTGAFDVQKGALYSFGLLELSTASAATASAATASAPSDVQGIRHIIRPVVREDSNLEIIWIWTCDS
jgi:hypothetical protein